MRSAKQRAKQRWGMAYDFYATDSTTEAAKRRERAEAGFRVVAGLMLLSENVPAGMLMLTSAALLFEAVDW